MTLPWPMSRRAAARASRTSSGTSCAARRMVSSLSREGAPVSSGSEFGMDRVAVLVLRISEGQNLRGVPFLQHPPFALRIAKRIGRLIHIAQRQRIDALGSEMAALLVILVDDVDHLAVDRDPMIRVGRIHEQQ